MEGEGEEEKRRKILKKIDRVCEEAEERIEVMEMMRE